MFSLQIKNMIAALDHSHLDNNSTIKFVHGETSFGNEK